MVSQYDEICKLCWTTEEKLKNKGTHPVTDYWKRKGDGSGEKIHISSHTSSDPDRVKIEEHHYSYFPPKIIHLCTNCHNLVHYDDEFICTELRPPVGHSRIFRSEEYDENKRIFRDDEIEYMEYLKDEDRFIKKPRLIAEIKNIEDLDTKAFEENGPIRSIDKNKHYFCEKCGEKLIDVCAKCEFELITVTRSGTTRKRCNKHLYSEKRMKKCPECGFLPSVSSG